MQSSHLAWAANRILRNALGPSRCDAGVQTWNLAARDAPSDTIRIDAVNALRCIDDRGPPLSKDAVVWFFPAGHARSGTVCMTVKTEDDLVRLDRRLLELREQGFVAIASDRDAKPAPPLASNLGTLEGLRVLVAEDTPDNQRLISHFLKSSKAQVTVVWNGQEALDAMTTASNTCLREPRPFDVILMDMQMPVMDGYTAASRLKELRCKVPIVALTANTHPEDKERSLAAGCDAYATKPIQREDLVRLCRDVLDLRSVVET